MNEKIIALTFLLAALAAGPARAEESVPEDDFLTAEELNNSQLESEMEYNQSDELTAQKIEAENTNTSLKKDIQNEKNKFAALKRNNERIKNQIQVKMVTLRGEQKKLAD